jgi:hypothetical protein
MNKTLEEIIKDEKTIIYCKSINTAKRLMTLLDKMGYTCISGTGLLKSNMCYNTYINYYGKKIVSINSISYFNRTTFSFYCYDIDRMKALAKEHLNA